MLASRCKTFDVDYVRRCKGGFQRLFVQMVSSIGNLFVSDVLELSPAIEWTNSSRKWPNELWRGERVGAAPVASSSGSIASCLA